MPNVFRLHTTGAQNFRGWQKTGRLKDDDIKSIPDTVMNANVGKIGSSIPSPFARMFLFEAAFRMMSGTTDAQTNVYKQLVSDCLDMFQFIFMNADDPLFSIREWNKNDQLENLKQSSFEEHRNLASALDLFFKGPKFDQVDRIYLFYYDKKLVGGTSPLTVLYTSPNWQRTMNAEGYEFTAPSGDILFDNDPYTIERRDTEFQLYMYRFVYAYNQELSQQSPAFFNYFYEARRASPSLNQLLEDHELNVDYTPAQFESEYRQISVRTGVQLLSGNFLLLQPKPKTAEQVSSDFKIAATQKYYQSYHDSTNTRRTLPDPLVLTYGNHRLKYLDQQWDAAVTVPDNPSKPLHERQLPGVTGYEYPYLTVGDFLEPTLVQVPFNLNRDRFYTGFPGDFPYLLPITNRYFEFFSVEDLERQLRIDLSSDGTVRVELNIPLVNGKSITLSRSYDTANKKEVLQPSGLTSFNLGFFPFYRITDQEKLNRYVVSMVDNHPDLEATFYKIGQGRLNVSPDQRSEGGGARLRSRFYHVREQGFDLVELNFGGEYSGRGIIIPRFKRVATSDLREEYKFGIDFGTSNTYITYVNRRQATVIHSFDVKRNDRQMVLLSEMARTGQDPEDRIYDGAKGARTTIDIFNNQFLPSFIGGDSRVSFPIRTALLQQHGAGKESRLFSDMNIGFALEYYQTRLDKDEYVTSLKWGSAREIAGVRRVQLERFFGQVVWMIKNKLIENKGKLNPTIVWMVPHSMSKRLQGVFKKIWTEQIEDIFGSDHSVTLEKVYESVAPNFAPDTDFKRSANSLSIDIGGGTTDVLYFGYNDKKFLSTSFRFAGNDIWGEGTRGADASQGNRKDSGFVQLMDQKMEDDPMTDQKLDNMYQSFKSKDNPQLSSADLSSLMFRHDKVFEFSETIGNHERLPFLLVLHYGAILYHLNDVLNRHGIQFPDRINFTGRGSNYLKILGGEEILKDLTEILLNAFTEGDEKLRIKHLKIARKPKELTARGAVSKLYEEKGKEVEEQLGDSVVYVGAEVDESLLYDGRVTMDKIDAVEGAVRENFNRFLSCMEDRRLRNFLSNELDMKINTAEVIRELREHTQESFDEMKAVTRDGSGSDEEVPETLFFWFLKDALYEFSKDLVQTS